MLETLPLLEKTIFPALQRETVSTLQVNLGYLCNQQCLHCHVNAGPKRTEIMNADNIQNVIDYLDASNVKLLDLTGGAPELNPHFRKLVKAARARNVAVIDRCNLTILDEPGQEDLAEFLAEHGVQVTASLPCYQKENVDGQRGKGVFEKSITGLKKLNQLGYGQADNNLELNLVYNPTGPFLPPPQGALEADYKQKLFKEHGIVFTQLLTLANMPIQRFGSSLISTGKFHDYMALLQTAHKDENLQTVMCRSLISVDWQGYLYDCDFNQMLDLPMQLAAIKRPHLRDALNQDVSGASIVVRGHCYGCTAGQGSSCGGALS
ncbi:MAG: arsenosugar biosynthesis radical SAM protein ArsS [Gammaproteobacteria bacterium]|nr:arsenosugar biosynthesis radical SAM protein ArsS [Gammaproteobacteria bacterium]